VTGKYTGKTLAAYHEGRLEAYSDVVKLVEEWVETTRPRYHTDLLAVLMAKRDGSAYSASRAATPTVKARRGT